MYVPEPGREKNGEGEESVMIKTTCPLWRSLRSHYGQNAREKRVRNKRRQPSGMPTRSLRRSGMERRADKFVDYSFERSSGFLLSWFRDLMSKSAVTPAAAKDEQQRGDHSGWITEFADKPTCADGRDQSWK